MIVDDTLREGLQMPGIAFTKEEKLKLGELISNSGVTTAIVSYPSAHNSEFEITKEIIRRKYFKTVFALGRATIEDVNKIYETGANISLHLPFQINNKNKLMDAIKYASKLDKILEVGLVNVTQYSINEIEKLVKDIENAGANRLQVSDSLGVALPQEIRKIVSAIKSITNMEIIMHLHNDLGLAITNAITALDGGADYIDTTLFGIGERNGIVDSIIIINYLNHLGIKTGINLSNLMIAYEYLEGLISKKLGYKSFLDNFPIYGKNVSILTAGTHAAFGQVFKENNFSLNVYTGKNVIKKILDEKNIHLDDEKLEYLVTKIKNDSVSLGKAFNENDLLKMVRDIYGKSN